MSWLSISVHFQNSWENIYLRLDSLLFPQQDKSQLFKFLLRKQNFGYSSRATWRSDKLWQTWWWIFDRVSPWLPSCLGKSKQNSNKGRNAGHQGHGTQFPVWPPARSSTDLRLQRQTWLFFQALSSWGTEPSLTTLWHTTFFFFFFCRPWVGQIAANN